MPAPTRFDPLPPHPIEVAWPTTGWPTATASPALTATIDRGFADALTSETLALVVIHRGRLVAERYAANITAADTLTSWSMAKSVTQAMVGLLVVDGLLDLHAPAPVPEWADDDRAAITLEHLLQMTSGLRFVEDYVDDQTSDVIEMLFGSGKDDVAAYARSFPLDHAPGTVFNYSSGTTNIIADICARTLAGDDAGPTERERAVRDYLQGRLFTPLGMTSAKPRFDAAGTFVGSSFLYCTAQDFARFGYLYLRDGVWDGTRLLPQHWVEHARRPVSVDVPETFWYGGQWWLWDDRTGGFACHGYEGQYTLAVPAKDAVVVRLGITPTERRGHVEEWINDIVASL